ncbi:MAG: aquaporin [Bryobacteraceae bacterium]
MSVRANRRYLPPSGGRRCREARLVVFVAITWLDAGNHNSSLYYTNLSRTEGAGVAFWAEFLISLLMMSTVLASSNSKRLSRFTGLFAGVLVAIYITVEAPFSGMSMNPARTLGSALSAIEWSALWVYFTAPPLAMLLAGQLYRWSRGARAVFCAKLHHGHGTRCIFRCHYGELDAR